MAILAKLSPANRLKVIADSHPNVWMKWDRATNSYLGYVEVKDNNGNRYQLSMGQIAWGDLKDRIDIAFKDAHA